MTTALYRRYRPDTFDEVIGQDHVTEPLRAALRANRVTHAYLFSGPRGCGKTSSARILARCLNCAEGPTDTPCGHCDSCRELATGGPGSLDVVEIDAASHGGVDDARDLRERATFAPVRDRYKVFIIDEAHMVTTQGFNALLKLVEEPPEHVKFIFATTEPDRVIGTIRSRTHHYPFRLVPPDVMEPFLHKLCVEEGITVGDGVLGLVVRAGGGSVRDTLSVLDQLMAGSPDGNLDYHRAVALLGYTDSALLDQTVDALAGGDGAAVFRVVERMVESGHDPRRFVDDLLQRLRDLLIIAVAGDGAVDVLAGTPADQLERMQVQARNWGPRHLSRAADLTDEALRSMTGATSPRLQLELLLGRILVPPTPMVAAADGMVPGTVGMTGGGAPREQDRRPAASGSSEAGGGESGRAGFGAAQAKAEFQRRRSSGTAASGGQGAPSGVPSPGAEGRRAGQAYEGDSHSRPTAGQTPTPHTSDRGASVPAASVTRSAPAPEPPTGPTAAARAVPNSTPTPNSTPAPDSVPTPAEPTGAAPHDTAPTAASPTGTAPTAAAPSDSTPGAAPVPGGSARDADMLRQRWAEVVERIAPISRATWSLVQNNGQLGGVDSSSAVIVFPTEGLLGAFVHGNRGADVEKAIHEVTGLGLAVRAEVGQASGGPSVTTPGAVPDPRGEVPAPRGDEGGPHNRSDLGAGAPADGGTPSSAPDRQHQPQERRPAPQDRGSSSRETSRDDSSPHDSSPRDHRPAPGGRQSTPVQEQSTDGWGPVAVPGGGRDSAQTGGPSAAVLEAPRPTQGHAGPAVDSADAIPPDVQDRAEGSEPARVPGPSQGAADTPRSARTPDPAPATGPTPAGAPDPASTQDHSPLPAGAPGPTHTPDPAAAPGRNEPADSAPPRVPSFADEADGADDVAHAHAHTDAGHTPGSTGGAPDDFEDQAGGWSEAVVAIPGGITEPAFDDAPIPDPLDAGGPSQGGAPSSRRWQDPTDDPEQRGDRGRHPGAADAGTRDTGMSGGRPAAPSPTGAPEPPAQPVVEAALDDSASVDDADMEATTYAGLPAVLEILGGTVIEETPDDGKDW